MEFQLKEMLELNRKKVEWANALLLHPSLAKECVCGIEMEIETTESTLQTTDFLSPVQAPFFELLSVFYQSF